MQVVVRVCVSGERTAFPVLPYISLSYSCTKKTIVDIEVGFNSLLVLFFKAAHTHTHTGCSALPTFLTLSPALQLPCSSSVLKCVSVS